jgi:uncharacterized protein YbdZ (MbtH family)
MLKYIISLCVLYHIALNIYLSLCHSSLKYCLNCCQKNIDQQWSYRQRLDTAEFFSLRPNFSDDLAELFFQELATLDEIQYAILPYHLVSPLGWRLGGSRGAEAAEQLATRYREGRHWFSVWIQVCDRQEITDFVPVLGWKVMTADAIRQCCASESNRI